MSRPTARGRAGAPGLPVHQGERHGGGPAIIPHRMGVELPAWAPPLRLSTVRVTFPNNFLLLRLIKAKFHSYLVNVGAIIK